MRIPRPILVLTVMLALVPSPMAQELPKVLPEVVQHAEPNYPLLARENWIRGEVRVKINTDGESV